MNKQLKRVSIVVLLMFVALMASTSLTQVVTADSLNADARNVRTLYDSYDFQRGPLLVEGTPIARSVPSNDAYKYQRVYSDGPLYAPVTGYYPIDGEATGLEGALNEQLSGRASSQFLDRVNAILTGKKAQGPSVELTLSSKVQQAASDALGDLQGAVVVMEPKTGKILGMVQNPTYDPNELASHDTSAVEDAYQQLLDADDSPLINKSIGDLNPPGSTFKLVVTAAALTNGYTPKSSFDNDAKLTLPNSDVEIHNSGFGTCGSGDKATLETALVLSCNIPFAELGMKLGGRSIESQAELFGFNDSINIPMTSATSAYPLETSKDAVAMSAYGQRDVTATALQMAMVSSGIAHSGTVMKPTLIDSVRSPDFKVLSQFEPEEYSRALTPANAATLRRLMVKGVDEGAASNARIDGVDVAGKTGTAQHIGDEPYTLWFTGFAPANDPQYAIAVVIENGGGQGQSGVGNTLAAPVAQQILEAVL